MKKQLLLILTATIAYVSTFAQEVPQAFNYQAIARNLEGEPLGNQSVSVRFTILEDGVKEVYSESHIVQTNQFGLFTLAVGKGGTVESGDFTQINWERGTKSLKVEFDPNGGTNYTDLGDNQLLSVPYALYAGKAGSYRSHIGSETAWQLAGNFGTDSASFLGTTDSMPIKFRVNNIHAGSIDLNNTTLGSHASLGANNLLNATAIGSKAKVETSNSIVLGAIAGVNGATTNTKIGIGTTTPQQALHVKGQVKVDTLYSGQIGDSIVTVGANGILHKRNAGAFADGNEFKSINGVVRNTSNVANDNFVFGSTKLDDTIGTADNSRFIFNKSKGAFRAGTVIGNQWNRDSLGTASFASGYNTKAKGDFSTSIGGYTTAVANYSTAIGNTTTASGDAATAIGSRVTASGSASTAMGYQVISSGIASFATGYQTIASGNYSMAAGFGDTASGVSSIAVGSNSKALGEGSFAAGGRTWALGRYSTVVGNNTQANGYASFVAGRYNDTLVAIQTAISATTPLFTVGNGTNSSNRKNAFLVRNDGKVAVGNIIPQQRLHVGGQIQIDTLKSGAASDSIVTVDANGVIHKRNVQSIDAQTLILSGNMLSIANGNTVNFPIDKDIDSTNEIQVLTISNDTIFLTNGGFVVLPVDENTDEQILSLVDDTIFLTNGGSIVLPKEVDADTTNELQLINLSGDTLSISKGNLVDLSVYTNTDSQTLSISGNQLSISGGNSVILPVDADADNTNELQTLDITDHSITISRTGSSVTVPDNQTLSVLGNTLSITGGNSVPVDTQKLRLSGNTLFISGGNSVVLPQDSITGSGNTNMLAKWKSNNKLTSSSVYNDDFGVGINTIIPSGDFDVASLNTAATPITDLSIDNGAYELLHNVASCWQSFIPLTTGYITQLKVLLSPPNPWHTGATLKIYSGEGIGGTLLHTQAVTIMDNGTATIRSFVLSELVPVNAGNKYTYEITPDSRSQNWIPLKMNAAYTDGQAYLANYYDMGFFQVDMLPVNASTMISTLTVNKGKVGVGTTAPTAKLDVDGQVRIRGGSPSAGAVLTSAADGLASWQTIPPDGDGNSTNEIQALSISNNTLSISSGNSVAVDTQKLSLSGNTLSITGGNSISLPQDSITGSGTANQLTKWNGTKTLTSSLISDNGTSVSVSLPSIVGNVSIHSKVVLAEVVDANLGGLPNTSTSNTYNWQSFTAVNTGYLTRVGLYFASFDGSPISISLRIYAGEGTGGTLLSTQSISVSNIFNGASMNPLSTYTLPTPVLINGGSKYTISFVKTGGSAILYVDYNSNGNAYTGGISNVSSADVGFATYVQPTSSSVAVLRIDSGNVQLPNLQTGGAGESVVTADASGVLHKVTAASLNTLSVSGNTLSISGGNSVPVDTQKLRISNHTLSVTGGNSITLPDNDNQTLSATIGTAYWTIGISGGNSITLPIDDGAGPNWIPKYTGAGLTTSWIYDNGTNVGIGTNNPIQARLVVNGYVNRDNTPGNGNWFSGNWWDIDDGAGGMGASNYSIYASNCISAAEFHAFSDARIKQIVNRSNTSEDLAILSQIKITDYKYIDSIDKGNHVVKKVIAQEVEEVYPQAVGLSIGILPNIYRVAEINEGWINTKADVKVGEKVKLIFENTEAIVEVLEVSLNGFKVKSKEQGKVFVYGTEVNDFRTVDYEAIAMLNVSATQELLKMINQLKSENSELKTDNQKLEATTQGLNIRLLAIENLLGGRSEK